MNRAQVCLISSSKSGERHLYLIKVSRDKISDSNEQETANCDAKGNHFPWQEQKHLPSPTAFPGVLSGLKDSNQYPYEMLAVKADA